jgi:asparagine synthase (glutamine-hydrolysing)
MCGIAGFVLNQPLVAAEEVLLRMTRALSPRGPDGEGYWHGDAGRLGLGHRRLAVVDLSEHGHQPMHSENRRFTITFNGEIYNFGTLRGELAALGCRFRGGSDTETALAAFEVWGVAAAIRRFVGMFAFVLWDRQERRLYIVRDRLGKKPLYYGWVNQSLVFGSELKALRCFPGFDATINRDALALYLRHNYVPAPYSIYKCVYKLPAGNMMTVDFSTAQPAVSHECYWDAAEVAQRGKQAPFQGSYEEAVEVFGHELEEAVRLRMIADVPLGAFLSGGIDSTLVVAMMAKLSLKPVKTFTIGFTEEAYNEANFAKAVAVHLGTDHTERHLSPLEAQSVIPLLPKIYCEPFSDSSQIATFLVSQEARRHVTVALSGDGGDELGCGYNRYVWIRRVWRLMSFLPLPVRRLFGCVLRRGGAAGVVALCRVLGSSAPMQMRSGQLRDRLVKMGDVLMTADARGIYRQLISHWPDPQKIVIGASVEIPDLTDGMVYRSLDELVESIMTLDTGNYLPDDILVKVDRASMACSLEARAPLLDHRLFELMRSMPLKYQLRGSRGKLLLRSLLKRFVPESLTERPKTGFGVPIDAWLREPLRDWAEDLLSESRLKADGYFDVAEVRRVWQQHVTGKQRTHYLIWDVLMFQSWLEHHREVL